MAESLREIEAQIAVLREQIAQIGDSASERGWYIENHGLNIGEDNNRMFTGGSSDWEAPKMHPVWANELAQEADALERMGAATFEYEPTRRQLETWAAQYPSLGQDSRYDETASPDHGAALDTGNTTLRAQMEAYREGRALAHDTRDQDHDHGMSY